MTATEDHPPGVVRLLHKLARTGLGALQNRGELLLVELQEEKERLIAAFVWSAALLFLVFMGLLLLTATIIFLFPESLRLWAAGGFAVLYLAGAAASVFVIKALLKEVPFAETIEQVRKDGEWLESLN
jgi:uncharacterized membrane protein YqjE